MYTDNGDIERIQGYLGSPLVMDMHYEIQPFEYDVVEGSMSGGRAHDVTMFIRGMEDPRLIAVIRKHFFPPGAYRAPSGAAHRGETLERGAAREALEETGLEIELERYLLRINARFTCAERRLINWTSHVFEARQVEGRLEPIDTDEIEAARWATEDELQGPIRRVLVESGWGLFRYRVALTDLTVELMGAGA